MLQAETQLKTTQAQLIDVGVQRAQLEHAIAVLIGKPASDFSIPATPLAGTPPEIPVGVPSELLERRPDIAASERSVAAANAQIGVAEAAFYPTVTLSASLGLESSSLGKLAHGGESLLVGGGIDFGDRIRRWPAAGPNRLRAGGLRRDRRNLSADHADRLSGGRGQSRCVAYPRGRSGVQNEAVKAAEKSVVLTMDQYKAGTVSYLNVVTAQTIALTNETTAVQILGQRMTAAVLLVQALGGGWNISDLPSNP